MDKESIKLLERRLKEQCFISQSTGGFGNYGCMDQTATNYDVLATDPCNSTGPSMAYVNCSGQSDYGGPGTGMGQCCVYPTSTPGCTDLTANNYNTLATIDDGTCTYDVLGCTDSTANNYDASANTDDGSCTYDVLGCTDSTANNYNTLATIDDGSCTYDVLGCTDSTACNYDITANTDDGSCCFDQNGGPCTGTPLSLIDVVGCVTEGSTINITWAGGTDCDNIYLSYNSGGVTIQTIIWNTTNTGSYSWTVPIGLSPTDDYYFYISNDNPNGSPTEWDYGNDWNICEVGCTDPTAINYNVNATVNDPNNPCIYPVLGCTDSLALNYDPQSTVDDGSCVHEEEPENCSNQLDIGCWVCKNPINFPGCQQISSVNQVTLATSYGLTGFGTQQDCVDNTECGNGGPCDGLDDYVINNYTNWSDPSQGGVMINLDSIHFCEKCKYNGLNDLMCKCCEECDKKKLQTYVDQMYGGDVHEYCEYCKHGMIQDKMCKCCEKLMGRKRNNKR